MKRPKIAAFQSMFKGLTLGHATTPDKLRAIREQGLTSDYVYACVGEGWTCEELPANVEFSADFVADRIYPDPEGQWGEHFEGYSMKQLVSMHGLEAVLDQLEACFNGQGWMEELDPTNPKDWNLVIVGPVPPEALKINQKEGKETMTTKNKTFYERNIR